MVYELRHFDTSILRFDVISDLSVPKIRILWVNEDKEYLLPLGVKACEEDLVHWLRHRTIPKNRAYVDVLLSMCGLSSNRPMSIISVTKGLSLNDCYWVVEEGFNGNFDDYNLYDNKFSRILGLIAFTGYGSVGKAVLSSSPEFTTNGMLPKSWRRINGEIYLYKGGTVGASNTGNEPFSEYYASQIAEVLGINAVSYDLSKWKGKLCSTCRLFTSKEISFVPIGRMVDSGDMNEIRGYYESLGSIYTDALDDMLVFDALICNVDRHLGNFGVLVNSKTNEIISPAPLFDHGNSLFNMAGSKALGSEKALDKYSKTLYPSLYVDFMDTAKEVICKRHREGLRKLLEFRFKRHPRYNLEKKRITLIEGQIRKRAQELLK